MPTGRYRVNVAWHYIRTPFLEVSQCWPFEWVLASMRHSSRCRRSTLGGIDLGQISLSPNGDNIPMRHKSSVDGRLGYLWCELWAIISRLVKNTNNVVCFTEYVRRKWIISYAYSSKNINTVYSMRSHLQASTSSYWLSGGVLGTKSPRDITTTILVAFVRPSSPEMALALHSCKLVTSGFFQSASRVRIKFRKNVH